MSFISLTRGVETIRRYAKETPATPGVYRMISVKDEILYIGKAKAIKKRILSYTHIDKLPHRLQRMVAETVRMEFIHTHTEVEALLLESNLIKKHKPRFNILLKDDKSFPYIMITGDHDYPLIKKYRGSRKHNAEYFGPYASTGAVNKTLETLQRIFQIRNCSDSNFANRSRPCLQYHIKRCTAPCVGKVSKDEYAEQINEARLLLTGKNKVIQDMLIQKMERASEDEKFEQAAIYRNRIQALSALQSKQIINLSGVENIDVIALHQQDGQSCIQVFFFRHGQNLGNYPYYPRHSADEDTTDIMANFLAQFYENKPTPKQIMINTLPTSKNLLEEALSSRRKMGKTAITLPKRGQYKEIIAFAEKNAADALTRHLTLKASEKKHLDAVAKLFDMSKPPQRVEVYDNSHLGGTNMVGGMIVAGSEGLIKSAYRKFNIQQSIAGDDYGMMREVMKRRFKQYDQTPPDDNDSNFPDLLLIDGGKGQLRAVTEILDDMGVTNHLTIVAIAKGEDRNAGRESFFMKGRSSFKLPPNDPTLHYLQRLRDEAHRFAIGAQRTRRKKDIDKSPLDQIPGIGAKKKQALLRFFGSAKAVAGAGIADLQKVDGISKINAEKIYDFFHDSVS